MTRKSRKRGNHIKYRRWLLHHARNQKGACCHCGDTMFVSLIPTNGACHPKQATLEHLIDYWEEGKIRDSFEDTAAACYTCNHKRGKVREKQAIDTMKANGTFPYEKIWASSGRYPQNHPLCKIKVDKSNQLVA